MKSVLVVSPVFPPSDAVDMHRVRMNVAHYIENGWVPRVLCVAAETAGRIVSPELMHTLPEDVQVRRVGAIPQSLLNRVGIRDVALRAYPMLRSAGGAWIREARPDLVFVSTTAFLAMPLAAYWRRRFGIPFVLDFQDPWSTAPPGVAKFNHRGAKHFLMRAIHAKAESATVPLASGLIAVSGDYINALRSVYPQIRSVPVDTIPFGYAERDFDAARRWGRPWRPNSLAIDQPRLPTFFLSAGRAGADMNAALVTLFSAMRLAGVEGLYPLSTMCAGFLGTGYRKEGNPEIVMPLANAHGVGSRVRERADRLPLLDSIASLLLADVLLLLGSDDLAYQPSKLHQYLATGKPILCIAPAHGHLAQSIQGFPSVVFLASGLAPSIEITVRVASHLKILLDAQGDGAVLTAEEKQRSLYSARTLASRECLLFDRALSYTDAIERGIRI